MNDGVCYYTTETGSVYKVDHRAQTAERISGIGSPTARMSEKGPRRYETISRCIGGGMIFVWEVVDVPDAPGNCLMRSTQTSRVVSTSNHPPS